MEKEKTWIERNEKVIVIAGLVIIAGLLIIPDIYIRKYIPFVR